MTILNIILFGMLAGVITLKVTQLAAAAALQLMYGSTTRIRQLKGSHEKVTVKHSGLDLQA